MTPDLVAAQDRAHLLVTTCMAGDRDMVGKEVAALDDLELLRVALVLIDLVAYVNHRWATATGMDAGAAWREMLADVNAWREGATP